MLNPIWIVVGLSLLASAVAITIWSHGRGRPPDLGFVSQQWLTEHRLSQPQDPER